MTRYIELDTLIAYIKASIKDIEVSQKAGLIKKRDANKKIFLFKNVLSFIDTLEVKEVKELTAFDRGIADEIIINLKRVEQDYRVDLTKEMEWVKNQV